MLVLDASRKDLLFLETVGAGQSEVEVISIADTVVLVLMPGSGDSIQALRRGSWRSPSDPINKLDHPAAKTMLNEVRSILSLDRDRAWRPSDLAHGGAARRERPRALGRRSRSTVRSSRGRASSMRAVGGNLAGEVFAVASSRAKSHLEHVVADDPELRRLLDDVQSRRLDPLVAVREIMEKVFMLAIRTSPSLADLQAARQRLEGIAHNTPVYGSETFSRLAGSHVGKIENLQADRGLFDPRRRPTRSRCWPKASGGRGRHGQRRQPRQGVAGRHARPASARRLHAGGDDDGPIGDENYQRRAELEGDIFERRWKPP